MPNSTATRNSPEPAPGGPPTRRPWWPGLLALAVLAGCASRPPERDGPGASPPPDLHRVPDAVPRVEPLRSGGPNKPYEVLGQRHVPMTDDRPLQESGGASWYGRKFHGRPTASGEPYDMYAMTAAHKTMPIPSYARVRNPANGREVIVRVNDRGPFVAGRVIDLSYTAAFKLGLLGGVAPVQVERLTHEQIRAGRWAGPARGGGTAPAGSALPPDDPAPGQPLANGAEPGPGYWLQLGAFRQREGAQALQQRALRDAAPALPAVALRNEDGLVRVHAGPYATREQALQAAAQVQALLGLSPVLLQRP